VIKASDFTDNAVGVIHTTGPTLSRLARNYGPLMPALRELILGLDAPQDTDVKDMIAPQLDATQSVRAQSSQEAEAPADDFFRDLGGVAEDRRDQHRNCVDSRSNITLLTVRSGSRGDESRLRVNRCPLSVDSHAHVTNYSISLRTQVRCAS
jgi:hypothetical protein